MKIRVYESEGIRTWRRGLESVRIARAVVVAVEGLRFLQIWKEDAGCYFADVVLRLRAENVEGLKNVKPATSYQAVERSLPFECGGWLYWIEKGEEQTKKYERTKRLRRRRGRLEELEGEERTGQKSLGARVREEVDARMMELEPLKNVYAMREEARRYMDAKFGALEARIAELEKWM